MCQFLFHRFLGQKTDRVVESTALITNYFSILFMLVSSGIDHDLFPYVLSGAAAIAIYFCRPPPKDSDCTCIAIEIFVYLSIFNT